MRHLKLITILCFSIFSLQAQVGINETEATPDVSAMLDIASTSKGMLVPRMSTAQRNAISSPATGLLVFDSNEKSFWFYTGAAWEEIGGSLDGIYVDETTSNIGIGTTDPDEKLSVFGDISIKFNESANLGTANTEINALDFYYNRNNVNFHTGKITFKNYSPDGSGWYSDPNRMDTGFGFNTSNNGTVTESMTINHLGNVGIGVSSASSPLEVNGAIEVSELKPKDISSTDKAIQVNGHSWINFRTGGGGAADRSGIIFSRYSGSHFMVNNESEKLRISYTNENSSDPQFTGATSIFNLDNVGNLAISGSLTQNSDRNLKKDFAKISNPLEKLDQLNGYYYHWKDAAKSARQVGVVAQEVEAVLPELISVDENGTRSVAYGNLTALLIEVNKQQELEKEALQAEVAALTEAVAELKNQNQQLAQQANDVEMLKAALLQIEARLDKSSLTEMGDE